MYIISLFFLILTLPLSLCGSSQKALHPLSKINKWYKEEKERTEGRFHKFATLATVSPSGKPYTRIVELIKLSSKNGAVFFTHKNSVKVQHLELNPHAAFNIYLPKTMRQVSLTGKVSPISFEETEQNWKRMPKSMKLNFILSNHKRDPISLETLEQKEKELHAKYKKTEIPMPSTFIGYCFKPDEVIFFEVRKRSFPIKEVAKLDHEHQWISSLVEP